MQTDLLDPKMIMINLYPCASSFRTGERVFSNPYFLYVHSGKGSFYIDGICYEALAGDLFFCPEGTANIIVADCMDPFVLSGIDFIFFDESTGNRFEVSSNQKKEFTEMLSPKINLLANTGHEYLIREMIDSYKDSTITSKAYCDSLLKSFLLNVLYFKESSGAKKTDVNMILKFIAENIDKKVTISEMAKIFCYHQCTINRLVTKATGMSVKEFQIELRMKRAKNFLLYSGKTVSEIAIECGYSNVFFFSRQFKQKTSSLPTDFRRQK
jgi:AraC-like DNA-binding protein